MTVAKRRALDQLRRDQMMVRKYNETDHEHNVRSSMILKRNWTTLSVTTCSEVHGMVALMELQASRFRVRVDSNGDPILLLDQNRTLWDHLLIRRGLASLERVEKLGGRRRR